MQTLVHSGISIQVLSVLMHLALFPMMSNLFPYVETVANGASLTDANTQLTPTVGKEQTVQESVYSKIEAHHHLPGEFEHFQINEDDLIHKTRHKTGLYDLVYTVT